MPATTHTHFLRFTVFGVCTKVDEKHGGKMESFILNTVGRKHSQVLKH